MFLWLPSHYIQYLYIIHVHVCYTCSCHLCILGESAAHKLYSVHVQGSTQMWKVYTIAYLELGVAKCDFCAAFCFEIQYKKAKSFTSELHVVVIVKTLFIELIQS